MAAKRRTKRRARAPAAPAEPLVNPFAARHGRYETGSVVDFDGELGEGRRGVVKVMLNRGGTAVDRWIVAEERIAAAEAAHDIPPEDCRRRLFGESEQQAIRYTRNLWTRAASLYAVDLAADKVDAPLGWSQHEALTQLAGIKNRVPRPYWDVYERVCRFDEEAGTAGSSLAGNSRSAIDAAKMVVAFVASLVAMWEKL